MKKIISFIRHGHPEIYKGLLFIFGIAAIVFIFPKQGKFKYEFQNLKGKPWYHEDLIAPFDFTILKSPEELASQKAEIVKNAKPYFRYNNSIVTAKKSQLIQEFKGKWNDKKNKNEKEKTLAFAKKIIDSIYSKGIIEPADIIENKPSDYSINVLNNNVSEEYDLNDFYTITSAYQYVQEQLKHNETGVDAKFILPLLENCITHSLFYDKTTSNKVLKQAIDDISPSRDIILKDQRIISKGEIIDVAKFQLLQSLKWQYEEQSGGTSSYVFILAGQILIITLCLMVLAVFLFYFRKDIFLDNTKITFILFLIILQVLMTRLALNSQSFSIYLLPFCIFPIIIRAFYDIRISLFVHLVTVLIISFMAPNRFEFAFIQLLGGMVAIFSIVNMHNRSQIFISAAVIFLTYSIAFTASSVHTEEFHLPHLF